MATQSTVSAAAGTEASTTTARTADGVRGGRSVVVAGIDSSAERDADTRGEVAFVLAGAAVRKGDSRAGVRDPVAGHDSLHGAVQEDPAGEAEARMDELDDVVVEEAVARARHVQAVGVAGHAAGEDGDPAAANDAAAAPQEDPDVRALGQDVLDQVALGRRARWTVADQDRGVEAQDAAVPDRDVLLRKHVDAERAGTGDPLDPVAVQVEDHV